jgi:hypothetical protein
MFWLIFAGLLVYRGMTFWPVAAAGLSTFAMGVQHVPWG